MHSDGRSQTVANRPKADVTQAASANVGRSAWVAALTNGYMICLLNESRFRPMLLQQPPV